MIELTEQQKNEEINDRIEKFKTELQSLSDNYKVQLEPVISATPRGIIPGLAISDLKYKVEKISELDLNREGRRAKKHV